MIDRELVLRKLDALRHHGMRLAARHLILASGLRNRLQHQYQTVDWRIVHASIGERAGDFDAFVAAIRAYLDSGAAGGRQAT